MGLFSKKKGGTFFGNLLATVANKASGGLLGAARVSALQSGNIGAINPNAKEVGKTGAAAGLFAGVPATQVGDTVTITQPLQEVVIKAPAQMRAETFNPASVPFIEKAGQIANYLGNQASKDTQFGVDPKTLAVVGVAAFALLFMAFNKK